MQTFDITQGLRQAAEALEKLPQLQESHAQKEQELNKAVANNVVLQNIIDNLNETVNTLNSKVRSLEDERDDAGFRHLEAQEKLEDMLRTFNSIAGMVSGKVAEHTPKPEVIEPEAEASDASPLDYTKAETVEATETTDSAHNDGAPPVDEWHRPKIEELPPPVSADEVATQTLEATVKDWSQTSAYDKPSNVSWKDFVAGGGRRPFWVTDEMMAAA